MTTTHQDLIDRTRENLIDGLSKQQDAEKTAALARLMEQYTNARQLQMYVDGMNTPAQVLVNPTPYMPFEEARVVMSKALYGKPPNEDSGYRDNVTVLLFDSRFADLQNIVVRQALADKLINLIFSKPAP
jgi:hypothetical protein